MTTMEAKNKTLVLEAFNTLFNKRDYEAAARYWSPNYIQHSAHIEPGREGLFNLIKASPASLKQAPLPHSDPRIDPVGVEGEHPVVEVASRCGPVLVDAAAQPDEELPVKRRVSGIRGFHRRFSLSRMTRDRLRTSS
jgi:hypothetical protein